MKKKVIVIGAGAAGLMAGIAAAQNGHRVTILEKNEKAGKKIYITGKGRCNLTNDCPTDEFFNYVARNHKFLYSAIYGFDHEMVKEFFEENGCPVKVERGNRVFPVSDHASDVTAALLRCLKKNGGEILYHTAVDRILTEPVRGETEAETGLGEPQAQEPQAQEPEAKETGAKESGAEEAVEKGSSPQADRGKRRVVGVRLKNGRRLDADAVILCTGGLSYPSTGSTGDGLRFAKTMGLDVTPTAPSLVPFETRDQWCRDLQGLALKNVAVRIFESEQEKSPEETEGSKPSSGKRKKKKNRPVYEAFGELLFTHFGLSGPIILTASCYCDFQKAPQGFKLLLDLKPALTLQQLEDRIAREFAAAPNRHLPGAVRPLFPARLAEAVTALSGLGTERRAASFTEQEVAALAALIKAVPVAVTGTRDYNEAIITRGGISVKEIDPSTMAVRSIEGLYAAGEVLDVDAQTGGFNLQIAWATGHLAGTSI